MIVKGGLLGGSSTQISSTNFVSAIGGDVTIVYPCGIINENDNICFFNAALQMIVEIPSIRSLVLSRHHQSYCLNPGVNSEACFLCLWEKRALELVTSFDGTLNIKPLVKLFAKRCDSYIFGSQYIAEEVVNMVLDMYRKVQWIEDDAYLIHVNDIFTSHEMTISKNFACLNCLQAGFPYKSEMPDRFVDLHHVALSGHRTNPFVESSEVCVSACSACNIRVGNYR